MVENHSKLYSYDKHNINYIEIIWGGYIWKKTIR